MDVNVFDGIENEELPFGEVEAFGRDDASSKEKFERKLVGKCPNCNMDVYEYAWGYGCSNEKENCGLTIGKVILGHAVTKEEVEMLLSGDRTELIGDFVSKKGKPFSAFLAYKDGKVGFEFESEKAEN